MQYLVNYDAKVALLTQKNQTEVNISNYLYRWLSNRNIREYLALSFLFFNFTPETWRKQHYGTIEKIPGRDTEFREHPHWWYVYVDKTPLICKMITEGKPYFMSRPRRFGKQLIHFGAAKFGGAAGLRQQPLPTCCSPKGHRQKQERIAGSLLRLFRLRRPAGLHRGHKGVLCRNTIIWHKKQMTTAVWKRQNVITMPYSIRCSWHLALT